MLVSGLRLSAGGADFATLSDSGAGSPDLDGSHPVLQGEVKGGPPPATAGVPGHYRGAVDRDASLPVADHVGAADGGPFPDLHGRALGDEYGERKRTRL